MIVGFPGETDEQFENLERFVQEARFDRMGAFTYSAEEGTRPAERSDSSRGGQTEPAGPA